LTNLATPNWTGLIENEGMKQVAVETLRKYGVGTCGPSGFYGTIGMFSFLTTEAPLLSYYLLVLHDPSSSIHYNLLAVHSARFQPYHLGSIPLKSYNTRLLSIRASCLRTLTSACLRLADQ
jgi:hypothetical protein